MEQWLVMRAPFQVVLERRLVRSLPLLLCAFLLLSGRVFAEPFQTSAPVAFLIETTSGAVLLNKNSDQPVEPAAMAKVMTIAVMGEALRAGETTLDTTYVISEETWRTGGAPSRSASMFAALKSRISVADLLRGATIQAANDACLALSEGLTGKTEGLVPRMNALAARIGLSHTTFRNVTGFADPEQTTTARDLATLLAWLIANHPQLYSMYKETDFTWNKIRQTNRNPLLNLDLGVDGGATGASETAGFGLIVSASRGEQRFILVVHGLKTAAERADEAKRILRWAETSFQPRLVFARGDIVAHASVFGGEISDVALATDRDVSILVRTDAEEKLDAKLLYDGPLEAPVMKGKAFGRLQILRDNQISLEVPLYSTADVPIGSLPQRAFGAIYELGVGLIQGGRKQR
jgi:serine-type D-Ala-D-Ala carboxypeptidase (penicillin-binding protein 5/6)